MVIIEFSLEKYIKVNFSQAVVQHEPHFAHDDHNFHVLCPQLKTFLAHYIFLSGSQKSTAVPPQPAQLLLLI